MKRPLLLRAAGVLLLALFVPTLLCGSPVFSQDGMAQSAADRVIREARIVGDRILYVADYDLQDRFDLYSAPLAGGSPIRLSASLPAGNVERFVADEVGFVVFAFRRADNNQRLLYSVAAAGGALTPLGPTYPGSYSGSQLIFGLSPNGAQVVYIADVSRFNAFELFSVPVAGGLASKLSVPLPGLGDSLPGQVTGFSFTPDGARVIYRALEVLGTSNGKLYSVPVIGGPSTLLATGVERGNERMTSDGAYVVYATSTELRSAPTDGSNLPTLIASGGNIAFALTPDGTRVVYSLREDDSYETKLYSAPVAGGAAALIGGGVRYADTETLVLTPDGSSVLYSNDDFSALLLAPILGGTPRTLSATQVSPTSVCFSEDGSSAIFVTSYEGARGIYRHNLSSGVVERIDSPADSAGGALLFAGDLLEGRAIYVAFAGAPENGQRLYSAPLSGGGSTLLTGSLGVGQEWLTVNDTARGYVLFSSGAQVGYVPTWRYLYVAPVDGATPARLVHQTQAAAAQIFLPLVQR